MPIATIENNVPFQQTNMLDSLYKGQTQRLDVNKAEADAQKASTDYANEGVDRQQLLEKKRWQRLARKVGAYKTKELWDGNEETLRKIAAEEGVDYQPWGDGTTYERIMRMGAEMDPQLLDIKAMTAENSYDPKTTTRALTIQKDRASRPQDYENDPVLKAEGDWSDTVMEGVTRPIVAPPGTNIYDRPRYRGRPQPSTPPPADGAPPPAGPQPIFRGAMPVEAVKIKAENENKLTTYKITGDEIDKSIANFEANPKLLGEGALGGLIGGVADRAGYGLNAFGGKTTQEARDYNRAYRAIVKMQNANLLDAKGTQTESDAARAIGEFLDSPGDRGLMMDALNGIKAALKEKKETALQINSEIDGRYGPLGGGQPAAPSAAPSAAPQAQPDLSGFKVRRN